MHTEAYNVYIRLQKELDELTAKNLGYSPATQKVKKLMRTLWPELTKTERAEFNPNSKLPKIKVSGVLDPFFETGCEGIKWVVIENGKPFNDALHFIQEGDHLTVYGENNEILFDGEIICDFQSGWTEYPYNPGHGQPSALGCWIHWTQHGWQPDEWAKLFFYAHRTKIFFREHNEGTDGKPLRAELITSATERK